MIVTNDTALHAQLVAILASTWRVKLFKNNLTPTGANVATDFTEADFRGYADDAVGAWTVTGPNGTAGVHSFTADGGIAGPQTIYGYYVVDSGGALVFSERFGASITYTTPGDQLNLTLNYNIAQI